MCIYIYIYILYQGFGPQHNSKCQSIFQLTSDTEASRWQTLSTWTEKKELLEYVYESCSSSLFTIQVQFPWCSGTVAKLGSQSAPALAKETVYFAYLYILYTYMRGSSIAMLADC